MLLFLYFIFYDLQIPKRLKTAKDNKQQHQKKNYHKSCIVVVVVAVSKTFNGFWTKHNNINNNIHNSLWLKAPQQQQQLNKNKTRWQLIKI